MSSSLSLQHQTLDSNQFLVKTAWNRQTDLLTLKPRVSGLPPHACVSEGTAWVSPERSTSWLLHYLWIWVRVHSQTHKHESKHSSVQTQENKRKHNAHFLIVEEDVALIVPVAVISLHIHTTRCGLMCSALLRETRSWQLSLGFQPQQKLLLDYCPHCCASLFWIVVQGGCCEIVRLIKNIFNLW